MPVLESAEKFARKSKPVPLQTPITYEDKNMEENKNERGWSHKLKEGFNTEDIGDLKKEPLVQGDSYDKREPSCSGNSKKINSENQFQTFQFSTSETNPD